MGVLKRWYRKFQKEEKYLNIFGRFFWSILILAIGWGMLWTSDTRFGSSSEWYHLRNVSESTFEGDQSVCHPDKLNTLVDDPFLFVSNREDKDQQIISNKAYITSYNQSTRNPNWVSWKLTSDHSDGIYTRNKELFYEDYRVRTPRANPWDYKDCGYDRGHMCPAADNRWNLQAMHESFAMTNVCPQNKDMNQNSWNEIEQLCRIWSREYGFIYIVCGPLYDNHRPKRIGNNRIAVPDAFFKVVLRMGDDPLGIGFICENSSDINHEVIHIKSIIQVENISRYIFFSHLPDSLIQRVKGNNQIERWYGTRKFIKQHQFL